MRLALYASLLIATPALAQSADTAATAFKAGGTLRDSTGARLGTIVRVYGDGSVSVILGDRAVRIPSDQLDTGAGRAKLTKREAERLR